MGFNQTDDCGDGISVRPFGILQADLDIDFDRSPRPVLISQLLQACVQQIHGADVSAGDVWRWGLKQRLQALLAIVVATRGTRMPLTAVCEQSGCRESIEVDLNLLDFRDTCPEEFISYKPEDDTQLKLRLPTGLDQLGWLQTDAHQSDDIFADMATSLVLEVNGQKPDAKWRVPGRWLESLAVVLEQQDALTTLQLDTICPACCQDLCIDFDLEGQLLAVLITEQTNLLHQIHRLASAYHWTESDILALSTKRRNYYLGRVDEGAPA